jgi:cytochrome c oxidase cbb3-type subunit III
MRFGFPGFRRRGLRLTECVEVIGVGPRVAIYWAAQRPLAAPHREHVLVLAIALLALVFGCRRERRETHPPPVGAGYTQGVVLSELSPGQAPSRAAFLDPYRGNAYAMNEGKRLFDAFNCTGCHAHGGGAIGPALMDDRWIYGAEPRNVFATIVEGRPNGMPSFRNKVSDYQVWQLVAYVRSLGGLAPMDAEPGRGDHMSVRPPESRTRGQRPRRQEAPVLP